MTVAEVAASVANDIRTYGHYQNKPGQKSWNGKNGRCCIIECPTNKIGSDEFVLFYMALIDKIGSKTGVLPWNDLNKTEVVLATLDEMANVDA